MTGNPEMNAASGEPIPDAALVWGLAAVTGFRG